MADGPFLASSYGGISFFLARIETEDGNDIAVQAPSNGNRHYTSNRGNRLLGKSDCEILFVDEPGKPSFVDRFREFRDLVNGRESQIFVHPVLGSYRAQAEKLTSTISKELQIHCQCTFIPEEQAQPVTPASDGAGPAAAAAAVTAAANAADTQLAAIGLSSPAPAEARDIFRRLSDLSAKLDPQRVLVHVATASSLVNEAIELHDLAGSFERWESYKAMLALYSALRDARTMFYADSKPVIKALLSTARSLRSYCAELYGADRAEEMADQVARLNNIRTPARVPAGTILTIPAPGAA